MTANELSGMNWQMAEFHTSIQGMDSGDRGVIDVQVTDATAAVTRVVIGTYNAVMVKLFDTNPVLRFRIGPFPHTVPLIVDSNNNGELAPMDYSEWDTFQEETTQEDFPSDRVYTRAILVIRVSQLLHDSSLAFTSPAGWTAF